MGSELCQYSHKEVVKRSNKILSLSLSENTLPVSWRTVAAHSPARFRFTLGEFILQTIFSLQLSFFIRCLCGILVSNITLNVWAVLGGGFW